MDRDIDKKSRGRKGYTRGTRWFTYDKSHPAPMKELYPFIAQAYERGASNVILSTAPDHTGRVRDEDIEALIRIRRLIDGQEEWHED